MKNFILKKSSFVFLFLLIIALIFLLIKVDEKNNLINLKILELEAKNRVEFYINTHSELSYSQILYSLGQLEEMLINKDLIEATNSKSYQKLYKDFSSLKGKFDNDDLMKIPNYYELDNPSVMAVVVKSYYNVMSDFGYDHFKLTIEEINKFLEGDPSMNLDHLFVNIDKMNVEGDFLRIFMLLQVVHYL